MPIILGFDVSGVVRGMGKSASGFGIGDEVYASPALVRNGSNAEFVCVDARTAAPKLSSPSLCDFRLPLLWKRHVRAAHHKD